MSIADLKNQSFIVHKKKAVTAAVVAVVMVAAVAAAVVTVAVVVVEREEEQEAAVVVVMMGFLFTSTYLYKIYLNILKIYLIPLKIYLNFLKIYLNFLKLYLNFLKIYLNFLKIYLNSFKSYLNILKIYLNFNIMAQNMAHFYPTHPIYLKRYLLSSLRVSATKNLINFLLHLQQNKQRTYKQQLYLHSCVRFEINVLSIATMILIKMI